MTLRSGAVEAIARALFEDEWRSANEKAAADGGKPWTWTREKHKVYWMKNAAAALDVLLLYLGEHTEEWERAAIIRQRYNTSNLLAVLGSGEELP